MDSKELNKDGFTGSPRVQKGFMNRVRFMGSPPIYRGEPCEPSEFTIIIDSREQNPLTFTRLSSIRGTLQSGDYSIAGLEHLFAIERKSLDDLAMSVTSERERFE